MTRTKRQPTADAMREQLRLAAAEIIRLRSILLAYGWDEAGSVGGWIVFHSELSPIEPRWWHRLMWWRV